MAFPAKGRASFCQAALVALCLCVCLAARAQSPTVDKFEALLKQGFELHQQARFTEAIPLLESARRLQPGDYFANLLLGIDLMRTGKVSDAVPRLRAAARARPSEDIPQDYLGEAEATLGDFAQAAEAFQAAMGHDRGSEQAQEAWAGFALERFCDLGYELRASSPGLAAGRRLQKAAASPSASLTCSGSIPAFERSLPRKPPSPLPPSPLPPSPLPPSESPPAHPTTGSTGPDVETIYQLSICYAVEAGKVAARLQSTAKDQAAIHQLRGDVLLRLKEDGVAAQEEFRQAIALRPGDPSLLERLAEAQLAAGDTGSALESAKASLAIDPHRRESLRTLASIAMSNRDYDQALPPLRQLAAESPNDASVRVQLGKALAQTGDFEQALRFLGPPLAADYPDEKGALHGLLSHVLHKLGREADAAKQEAEARRLSDSFQATGSQVPHDAVNENQ